MTTATEADDPYRLHRALEAKVRGAARGPDRAAKIADARQLFEALGLVDYDGTELRPDDGTNIPITTLGTTPVGAPSSGDAPTKGRMALVGVEPPQRDRSMVPAGLRDLLLTPDPNRSAATAPRPKKAAAKKATPKPARRGPAPRPAPIVDRAPVPTVADVRRGGFTYERSERVTATDLPDTAARTTTPPPPARPSFTVDTTPEPTPRKTGPKVRPIEHGTIKGYFAHYRRRETPVCRACKDAYNGSRSPQRRVKAATVRARVDPRSVGDGLDVWVESASTSPFPAVQRAAAVVSGSLMALRIAVAELSRAEDAAIAPRPAGDDA